METIVNVKYLIIFYVICDLVLTPSYLLESNTSIEKRD